MTGRRDEPTDEIEITPEMIDAGGAAYMDADLRFDMLEDIASNIYRAMEAARIRKAMSTVE